MITIQFTFIKLNMAVSVTIFGANGVLSGPTLEALQSPLFKDKISKITVVSRSEPQVRLEGVNYVISDVSKPENTDYIIKALKGTDAAISLSAADPSVDEGIEKVVTKLPLKVYIPSQFGADVPLANTVLPGFVTFKIGHSEQVRKAGIKVVDIYTGFFHQEGSWSYEIVGHYGLDPEGNVTQRVGNDIQVSVTHPSDIGNTVATIVTSANPNTFPDTLRIESEKVTYADVQKTWSKNHNIPLKEVKQLTKEEVKEEIKLLLPFDPKNFFTYLHDVAAFGYEGGLLFKTTDNELVNPGEKQWKWVKFERNL